jgi:hypothetical protein
VLAGRGAQPNGKAVLTGALIVPRRFVLARLATACKLQRVTARLNSPRLLAAAVTPDCLAAPARLS